MNPATAAQPAKSNGETSRTTRFTATANTLQQPPATALATGITVGPPRRESVAREFTLPSLPTPGGSPFASFLPVLAANKKWEQLVLEVPDDRDARGQLIGVRAGLPQLAV